MQKSRFLIVAALAALALCASAVAASPSPSGYPMATQSVSADQHAQAAAPAPVAVQAMKDVSPISLKTADSGNGAESAYQAWAKRQVAQTECKGCRIASTHPGCGQPEPHPSMKKGKGGKGGGGKKCVEVGSRQLVPFAPFTRFT